MTTHPHGTTSAPTWHLFRQMLKREIQQRYRGSLMGIIWAFVTPLLMLAIYTFVFSFVFKAKFAMDMTEGASLPNFAVILFSGLILHSFMSECLSGSVNLISNNANLVKKVIFPLWILPLIQVSHAMFHLGIGVLILVAAFFITGGTITPTSLIYPFTLLPFLLLIIGLSWLLACLGVFLQDLHYVISLLMTVLLFLSPIFYNIEVLPEMLRPLLYLNPLTVPVEWSRAMLFGTATPTLLPLLYYSGASIVVLLFGHMFFSRCQRHFADML